MGLQRKSGEALIALGRAYHLRPGRQVGMWQVRKGELSQDGRVKGLPGRRGWRQDIQVPPTLSTTHEPLCSHTHFYFSDTILKKKTSLFFFPK